MDSDIEKAKKIMEENNVTAVRGMNGVDYILKDGEVVKRGLDYYNSKEQLQEHRARLTTEAERYPVYEELEDTWSLLDSHYDNLVDRKDTDSPLSTFMYCVDMGFYPPPEVMLSILECFQHYESCGGEVELEDIFFGKRQKGVGNHSAQESRRQPLRHLWFLISCENHLNNKAPKKSQVQLAEEVIDTYRLDIDPESLLRQYRRKYPPLERER